MVTNLMDPTRYRIASGDTEKPEEYEIVAKGGEGKAGKCETR